MNTLIIDGNNLLHRVAWISRKRPLITQAGENVSILFHTLKSIRAYAELFKTNDIYLVWDKLLQYPSTNFRKRYVQARQSQSHAQTPLGYKDGRTPNTQAVDEIDHLALAAQLLGCKNIYPNVLEADDVISWISQQVPQSVIISADKDLLQLVSDTTSVYNAQKKQLVNVNNFEEIVGVPIQAYLVFKALLGDPSDNIKGVYGFGPVKAKTTALTSDLSTLNAEQQEILEANLELMDLKKGYYKESGEIEAYKKQFESMQTLKADLNTFKQFCVDKQFNSILMSFSEWTSTFSEVLSTKRITLKQNP